MCILHVFGVQMTDDQQRRLSVKAAIVETSTVSETSVNATLCMLTLARGFQVKHMKTAFLVFIDGICTQNGK